MSTVQHGDLIQIEIGALGVEGEGVARVGQRDVHVPGAFPGERLQARVVSVSRHHARAHAAPTLYQQTSSDRRAPPCVRHPARGGACNGCPLLGLDEVAQRAAKAARLAGLGLDVTDVTHDGRALGYRWSSKRVAGERNGRFLLGSYRRDTHQVADMTGCAIDHPRIAAAADEIARVAGSLAMAPWNESARTGDLRYVWLKTDGERVLVTLITGSDVTRAPELAAALTLPYGVAHAVQAGAGNSVRGSEVRALRGAQELEVELGGAPVRVGPLGFLQPNPPLAERAYAALVSAPDGTPERGELALDLYAGAGATSVALGRHFARVVPCESYPESARLLGVEPETVEAFLTRALADATLASPDLIVANPPRGGLGQAASDLLARSRARRLTIMSCSPDALARDLTILEAAGWRRRGLAAFDTLPQTAHVELVVWLTRD